MHINQKATVAKYWRNTRISLLCPTTHVYVLPRKQAKGTKIERDRCNLIFILVKLLTVVGPAYALLCLRILPGVAFLGYPCVLAGPSSHSWYSCVSRARTPAEDRHQQHQLQLYRQQSSTASGCRATTFAYNVFSLHANNIKPFINRCGILCQNG